MIQDVNIVKIPKELDSDIGYLPDMILNELKRGRAVRVVGTTSEYIKTLDDYERVKERVRGKFGVCKFWAGNTAHIATRGMPRWAIPVFEQHRKSAPEACRWIK